jgi:M6 family metalloprotease-like protein
MLSTYFSNRDQGVELTIHEGGHALGLSHATSRDFGSESLGAPGVEGAMSEYGDSFSAMGYWNFGHYAAPHKVRLGWMTSDVQTITSNGSFSVAPAEYAAGLHALKIQRGVDNTKWLWLEYRKNTGLYDSTLPSQVFTGGLIHYEDSYTGNKTNLLDLTASTSSFSDPALGAIQK